MLYKLFSKQLNILFTSALFFSFSGIKSHNHYFDIRDENIGYDQSPTPNSSLCLLPQAVTGATTTIYRNSSVEPSVAVNPQDHHMIVAAWQQDRISNGGALDIAIAHSEDKGHHWQQTVIPCQNCTGGFIQRVSDVWLSYGQDGKVYLVALALNASLDSNTLNQSGVIASVSADNGQTWSNPHFLVASSDYLNEQTLTFPSDEKPSITTDSQNPGYAYAVWNRFPMVSSDHSDALSSYTTDGGVTWAPHFTLYDPFNDATFATINNGIYNNMSVSGNLIVEMPNGDLLNFMVRTYAASGTTDLEFTSDVWPYQYRLFDIAFVRSTDHGVTWETDATVVTTIDGNSTFTGGYTYSGNTITGGVGNQTRTEVQLFNVAVNPDNGYLYVVYQSGEFSANQLPQIALITSRDGGTTWSEPARVSRTDFNAPNPQAFTPAVAVATKNHVGIIYHDFRKDSNAVPTANDSTKTNVWFAEYKEESNPAGGSTGIGLDFVHELRVSEHSYIMQNGPVTNSGIMTNGDYNSLVAHDDDFYALYIKSHHGPFVDAQTLIDNVETSTILLLDDNYRTSPYFSKIDEKH